jgi:C4-dicarboxylate transporter DctQ subunit
MNKPGSTDRENDGAKNAPSLTRRMVYWLVQWCGAISCVLVLAILVLVIYSVIQRYVLNTPLKWGDEMLGYLLVAFIMLGAAQAQRKGDHIAIDILSQRVTGTAGNLLRAFSSLAIITFAFVLGFSTWKSIAFGYAFGSYSPGYLEVATWVPQVPMLIGALLLGLTGLVHLVQLIAGDRPR